MELLVALHRRAGEVVSKEELIREVWHGDFVSDHVLSHAVWQLRTALRDPHLIESIPKRGYRLAARRLGPRRAAPRPATAGHGLRSIVVLPLANLAGDPQQEYFADGMTEALILRLAQLDGLRVISRTSAMQYKGRPKPIRKIGSQLGVDLMVEGSVFRAGERVRISAQLIDVRTDNHIWAGSYERDLANVLQLQRELADAIAASITATLQASHHPVVVPAVNPEAYEAYLKGRFYWCSYSPASLDLALHYFRLAAEWDPNLCQAQAGMAQVWYARENSGVSTPAEAVPQVRAAAERALASGPNLAEAHAVMGIVKFHYEWDWPAAEHEYRKAVELNPNDPDFRVFLADFLFSVLRPDEGFQQMEQTVSRDPLNHFSGCYLGWYLLFCRRIDEAIEQLNRVACFEPNFAAVHQGLWGAFYLQRKWDQALRAAKAFFTMRGDPELIRARSVAGKEHEYRLAMREGAESLAARSRTQYIPNLRIARLYAHAGDRESAFSWLERAYQQHESPLVHLSVAWDWDALRQDPRFLNLLRRIGLPIAAS